MIKVQFTNNLGGGFAGELELEPGTTVLELFEDQLPGRNAGDFLIRVNRESCLPSQQLCDGDKVSVTPTKIDGATS